MLRRMFKKLYRMKLRLSSHRNCNYMNMLSMITVSIVLLLCFSVAQSVNDAASDPLHYYFSTKNRYHVSRILMNRPDFSDLDSLISDIKLNKCDAVQVSGLMRHGTRNPGSKDLLVVKDLLTRLTEYEKKNGISSSHVKRTLENFQTSWHNDNLFPNAIMTDKELIQHGYGELFEIAMNTKRLFPSVFLDPARLSFVTSETHRTIHSCLAFQDGLQLDERFKQHTFDNDLIRFYDYCGLYLDYVANNVSMKTQHDLYKIGPEIQGIITKLQRELTPSDASEVLDIRYKDLKALYTVAACEHAAYGKSSLLPLFDRHDLAILEYAGDLRSYWRRSYGFEINYSQACILLKHMIKSMEDYIHNSERAPTAVFRFGHAETLFPILTLLGLYNDTSPLNADTFLSQKHRLFRTAKIMPFAANIMFVLYRCEDLDADESVGQGLNAFKVLLLHNEKPVSLPACSDKMLCPFGRFLEYYKRWTEGCNFTEICRTEAHDEL